MACATVFADARRFPVVTLQRASGDELAHHLLGLALPVQSSDPSVSMGPHLRRSCHRFFSREAVGNLGKNFKCCTGENENVHYHDVHLMGNDSWGPQPWTEGKLSQDFRLEPP